MPKVLKIISLQYLRNDMVDYLDFWYVYRPPSCGNNLLHMSVNQRLLQMINFFSKMKVEIRGLAVMPICYYSFCDMETFFAHPEIQFMML